MSANDFPVPAETAKAPKGSVARLIQVAKSQVGYIEGPKDNETKYGAYTKANFQPWCGSFVNLPILISPQMALIVFLMSELLLKITKMGPYGVLKEILLQRNQEAKEMAEKLVNNFVLLRKTKQEFKFQL